MAKGSGIIELKPLTERLERMACICERFMGSLKRECLDHILILHGQHLRRVVKEFTTYFNQERPHQGMGQQNPDDYNQPEAKPIGSITARPILGGLHHSYSGQPYLL